MSGSSWSSDPELSLFKGSLGVCKFCGKGSLLFEISSFPRWALYFELTEYIFQIILI
jgi:hypothetical protein